MLARVQVTLVGDLDAIVAFLKEAPVDVTYRDVTPPPPPTDYQDSIRAYLIRKNMKATELAGALGLHKSTISFILNRQLRMSSRGKRTAERITAYMKANP